MLGSLLDFLTNSNSLSKLLSVWPLLTWYLSRRVGHSHKNCCHYSIAYFNCRTCWRDYYQRDAPCYRYYSRGNNWYDSYRYLSSRQGTLSYISFHLRCDHALSCSCIQRRYDHIFNHCCYNNDGLPKWWSRYCIYLWYWSYLYDDHWHRYIYTFVGIFLWPVKVKDNTVEHASSLLDIQSELYKKIDAEKEDRKTLHQKLITQEQLLQTTASNNNALGEMGLNLKQWSSIIQYQWDPNPALLTW